jgi:hypothetical protein
MILPLIRIHLGLDILDCHPQTFATCFINFADWKVESSIELAGY